MYETGPAQVGSGIQPMLPEGKKEWPNLRVPPYLGVGVAAVVAGFDVAGADVAGADVAGADVAGADVAAVVGAVVRAVVVVVVLQAVRDTRENRRRTTRLAINRADSLVFNFSS